MTLYSGDACAYSHRTRIVLAEKNISAEIVPVKGNQLPEDLIDLNPYNSVPTLVDRDLVLYTANVIIEYLDERYPHPPLFPVDPVNRARTRLYIYRIDRDWYSLLDRLVDSRRAGQARTELRDSLTVVAPIFEQKPFFMSDEFTMADAALAPLLWRLTYLDIELPRPAQPLLDYADRLFERPGFQASLTEAERKMRE